MLCCVCLLEFPNNMAVFDDVGQKLKVAEIIQKYLWFKPENAVTSEICAVCWHKLDDFHIFYQTVEKAHKEYQTNAAFNIKNETIYSSSIKQEQYDEVHDKNMAFIDEGIDNKDNDPIETGEKNPLGDSCINDFVFNNESDDECRTSDEYEPSLSSEHESLLEELVSNDEEYKLKNESKEKKKTGKKRLASSERTKNPAKKNKIIQRLDPIHTEEMIKKHIPMGCNLCVFVGKSFPDIVDHFKENHPKVRPFIMCCDRRLTKRYYVAQHAMKHEDPNCFKCEECSKSFTSNRGLRTHNVSYHAREEDLIYACDTCPKKFARRSLLELHKTSHLPREQWKHFCKICPNMRPFANAYLLNIHTNMRHKREINVCPVCAKEIKSKKSFEKHVRLHYEDSGPRVKCPYADCDSWLKDEDNLRLHIKRHNPGGIIYKCDVCEKEFKYSTALSNHKRYSHSNEIFHCEQCDKTFKKAITLREHMAQHTGETLYKCPFCTRTFNSNANMHAHKKKQHPVEWEEWRKNKRGSAQKLINNKNPLNNFEDTQNELNDISYF